MKEDIGIYTSYEVFEHKSAYGLMYWKLKYMGDLSLEEMNEKGMTVPKRLWIAFDGYWRGCFEIYRFTGNEIEFHGESWKSLAKLPLSPRTPFRGFTYNTPN